MKGSQQSIPLKNSPRFSDNGLLRRADKLSDDIRKYKSVTSDVNRVNADRLAREEKATEIGENTNLQFSSMISDYNQKVFDNDQR